MNRENTHNRHVCQGSWLAHLHSVIIPHVHRTPVDPGYVKVQRQSRQVQGKHVSSCIDSIGLLHFLKIGPWPSKSES